MSKKIISLALALIMALGLFSTTALAGTPATGNLVLSLNKTNYAPGESIIASVSGIVTNPNNDCCVFLCNPGDPIDKNIDYWWIRGTTNGTNRSFPAPNQDGKYEVRLFTDGSAPSTATFVMKIEFTVGDAAKDYKLSLNKTAFAPGESITATVTGIGPNDNTDNIICVFLCNPNDPIDQNIDYWWIRGGGATGTSDRSFPAPEQGGQYEIRLFSNGNVPSTASFVTKIPITVSGDGSTPAPTPTTPTTPPVTQPQATGFTATAVDSGVKFGWGASSGNLGYRVFRSASQGDAGVFITDFAIGGTSFVDVNVDPNTTYYYTLYAVIKEATAGGEREQLSEALGTATVKTGATILGGGATENGGKQKSIILMKLNDQNMSVNGKTQPIDPGNTTAPVSMNGRTMVPIRAIIEAMGGTVGWEQATSKITLSANGHNVTMWDIGVQMLC